MSDGPQISGTGRSVGEADRGGVGRAQSEWARQRLRVVRLIAQHELTAAQIMRVCDVSRQTVFTYRDKVVAEGVAGLLRRDWKGARVPAVRGAVAAEFIRAWRPASSGRRGTRRLGSKSARGRV